MCRCSRIFFPQIICEYRQLNITSLIFFYFTAESLPKFSTDQIIHIKFHHIKCILRIVEPSVLLVCPFSTPYSIFVFVYIFFLKWKIVYKLAHTCHSILLFQWMYSRCVILDIWIVVVAFHRQFFVPKFLRHTLIWMTDNYLLHAFLWLFFRPLFSLCILD